MKNATDVFVMLLKEFSYYRTGGSFHRLYAPKSVEELAAALSRVHSERTPYFLLGAGSNSLIMDDHWPGAVILFSGLDHIGFDETCITAGAGMDNSRFVEACLQKGMQGASWLYYMPGQLGSTVRMNARCYGGEISQIVRRVKVVSSSGKIKTYGAEEIFLGYKNTVFMLNDDAVAEIDFELKPGSREEIQSHMDFCRNDRESKHQFLHPSCGCVFKNDYNASVPSGVLLEQSGVRQFSTETVEISPYHANFVFNKGASAREILEVTLLMREAVFETFGVWLEYEMEVLGRIPDDLEDRFFETKSPQFDEERLAPLRISAP